MTTNWTVINLTLTTNSVNGKTWAMTSGTMAKNLNSDKKLANENKQTQTMETNMDDIKQGT